MSQDFDRRYRLGGSPALLEIEREVLGSDYGATGYTGVAEAERLAAELRLHPSHHLLDVGCGAGWPGLFLARATGCAVTLADLPVEGLRRAATRAALDGTPADVTVARGEALPFRDAVFDGVVSVDALC